MSQCVPSWELDDSLAPFNFTIMNSSNSFTTTETPSLDYEVTELTWENGQLAVHGLAPPPRVVGKDSASQTTWDKPRAGGTLESIVNQATRDPHPKSAAHGGGVNELVPWFNHHHAFVNPAASATMTMDALVPCNNNGAIRRKDINKVHENSSSHVLDSVPGIGTCMVGSCSGASTGGLFARAGPCRCRANPAVSESATCGTGGDSRQVTLDSCERDFGGGAGMTSTSLWSPENTSSGKEDTKTSGDDHDSICHSRPQKREASEKSKRKGSGKSLISAKSRAAAIHNQSERKRRDKINQRMKTLQKLVPNSSKTDKASMLDEVIEYLKQLQAQVHMMGRMNMPNMMMSYMQQQLHMNMMAQAMGMGTMGVMDMGRPTITPPIIPTTAATNAGYMPWDIQGGDRMHVQPIMPDVLSTFLASQSHPQPMTVDGYTKLAALYQQFQQPSAGSGSKN